MPPNRRRDAVRVRGGRTQKKNNWRPDRADYFALAQDEIRLDRRSPGPGFRHLLTIAQLRSFVGLLPDWDEVAVGLDAIVLDAGEDGTHGWAWDGVVAVCAWEHELWWEDCSPWFVKDHREVFDLIGVDVVRHGRRVQVRWTEAQARAFQLLHILPHELGHHHDRITTRSWAMARGEAYAEDYALRVQSQVWPAYAGLFEL
jgi:hypothetical protein